MSLAGSGNKTAAVSFATPSSGGGSLPGGLKMATGIIYLDATGTIWDVLDNSDHTAYNIDSVSINSNNVVVDYTSLGLTKVVSGFAIPDDSLAAYGISLGISMGLAYSEVSFFTSSYWNMEHFLSFDGASWSVQQYGGNVTETPTITGYNAATGVITMSFSKPVEFPITNIKTGGTGYQNYRVVEYSSGFGYTTVSLKLVDWSGAVYTPVSGDWFIITRENKWITGATSPARNSPTNQLTGTNYIKQLSSFLDITTPSPGYTNFQFLLFGI